MCQMLVDFRKAYDSIHRNSLYNIMEEFGLLFEKLINLTKLSIQWRNYKFGSPGQYQVLAYIMLKLKKKNNIYYLL